MLLCYSTHIVMTKEVAETEMHAAKRLQEAIRQETGLILPFSVGEVREGDLSLGIAKTLPEQTYEITIDEKGGRFQAATGLACFMVWRPSARSYSSVAGYCPVYRFRMPRICQTVVIILTRQGDVC